MIRLFPVLFLAACATSIGEDQATWYGASLDEVRAAWGAPTSTSKTPDGADVYTWVNESPGSSGASIGVGFGVFRSSGNVGVGVGTGTSVPVGGASAPHRCERKMTFRDGRVADVEFIGAPRVCSGYQKPSN